MSAAARKTKVKTPRPDHATQLQRLDALMTHPPVIQGEKATTVPTSDPYVGRWCIAVYNLRLGTYVQRPQWFILANALAALRHALNLHVVALHDLCKQLDLLGDDS